MYPCLLLPPMMRGVCGHWRRSKKKKERRWANQEGQPKNLTQGFLLTGYTPYVFNQPHRHEQDVTPIILKWSNIKKIASVATCIKRMSKSLPSSIFNSLWVVQKQLLLIQPLLRFEFDKFQININCYLLLWWTPFMKCSQWIWRC